MALMVPQDKTFIIAEIGINHDGDFYNKIRWVYCWANPSPGPGTPIILDLDRNQFHLSGGPVLFDINADGDLDSITWVSPGQLDAFLYLDRNANGIVDDGSELFGIATPKSDGAYPSNGYDALGDYDKPENGGVRDGVINSEDSIYPELRVWIDNNADAVFETEESFSLSEVGVVAIDLEISGSSRIDQYGNRFTLFGSAWMQDDGKLKKIKTTDVVFIYADQ